jgi:hypothetical protein
MSPTYNAAMATGTLQQHFTPWTASEARTCWTCAHSIGYDGTHLWCQRAAHVVVMPCGSWERGAGCDELE